MWDSCSGDEMLYWKHIHITQKGDGHPGLNSMISPCCHDHFEFLMLYHCFWQRVLLPGYPCFITHLSCVEVLLKLSWRSFLHRFMSLKGSSVWMYQLTCSYLIVASHVIICGLVCACVKWVKLVKSSIWGNVGACVLGVGKSLPYPLQHHPINTAHTARSRAVADAG